MAKIMDIEERLGFGRLCSSEDDLVGYLETGNLEALVFIRNDLILACSLVFIPKDFESITNNSVRHILEAENFSFREFLEISEFAEQFLPTKNNLPKGYFFRLPKTLFRESSQISWNPKRYESDSVIGAKDAELCIYKLGNPEILVTEVQNVLASEDKINQYQTSDKLLFKKVTFHIGLERASNISRSNDAIYFQALSDPKIESQFKKRFSRVQIPTKDKGPVSKKTKGVTNPGSINTSERGIELNQKRQEGFKPAKRLVAEYCNQFTIDNYSKYALKIIDDLKELKKHDEKVKVLSQQTIIKYIQEYEQTQEHR